MFQNGGGHAATDFHRWQNTTASYRVQFKSGFEPWCILARCARMKHLEGSTELHAATANILDADPDADAGAECDVGKALTVTHS